MQLLGKVALVTGGGIGTGRAIALKLARRGCHVAVNYSRSQSEAEATVAEIKKLGVTAGAFHANVANDALVRGMVRRVTAEFGRLDILVNNSGVTSVIPHADLDGVKEEDWDRILAVNLRGPFYAARAAAPALRENRGAIVNVSSIAGVHGIGSSIPYCASKAALNNLTLTLARALAPEVRVNAVAPGFIDNTRWWTEHPLYEVAKQHSLDRALLGRVGTPEDVASMVVDVVSSDLLTGQVIVLDGGMGLAR